MTVLVTGAAGFIGFHVANTLLRLGRPVVGIDNLNEYYDPALKRARLDLLQHQKGFEFHRLDVADRSGIRKLFNERLDLEGIVHLAAQAGVRHSLEDPFVYITTNVLGQVVLMEACRDLPRLKHMVYASSSSVYGANIEVPFSEAQRVDSPLSIYAASKRSAELMATCYAHLYKLPLTGLRFFTVYGPWGRPDMAAYIFAKAIFEGRPIRVFNHGRMKRDFTYIDDIVSGVIAALDRPPIDANAALPHKVYNLGNHHSEDLMRFIGLIEEACGVTATKEFDEIQPGDVESTFAEISEAQRDLSFNPSMRIEEGIPRFIYWFRNYHNV